MAIALLGNPNLGQHTCTNVNGLDVDLILENENGSCVDMILRNESGFCVNVILVNGNDPSVDMSWIGWITPHTDFPHYYPLFLGYLGPFFGAHLLPPIPSLSLVYATAPPYDLFPRIVHALRHLILFSVFDVTPLRGQTVPPFAHVPYLHVFYVFVPAMWILEKTLQICFWHGLMNGLQTFSRV